MKNKKTEVIIYVLTFIFMTIGTTFAYFSASAQSDTDAINSNAAKLNVKLSVLPLYTDNVIIPMNNSDIITAYNQECVDNLGNGACYAYTINVENGGAESDYTGKIKFNLNNITNLNYLLLDEEGNKYQDITEIVSDTDQTLGNSFFLGNEESKTFTLLVWLPNLDYPQEDLDADGSFGASVTYTSGNNGRVTAIFSN